jgi:arylsulfatase A-like enzyme
MPRSLIALLFVTTVAVVAEAKPPNILFLFADDMRADSIAALGNPTVVTPHLDALAKRGFAFTNAYCFGGNSGAVCTPSRNMLLSGNCYFRWKDFAPPGTPNRKGMLAPADGPNLPLSLKAAGYDTYHHGKRGNTATLIQAKFDVNKYLASDEAERKSGEPGREIADAAIDYWKARSKEKPFFCYLAFGNPHDPRVPAKVDRAKYDAANIALPANWKPLHPFDNGDLTVRDEQLLPWPRTEAGLRDTLADYYATVTGLDRQIGRLTDHLQSTGELANTIVVFSADQGIAVGSHGLLGKQNLYDHSMKAPLIFAGPGIRAGTSPALTYLFDIFPTLVEIAGAAAPQSIDGRSLKPILDGRSTTHRDELMLAYLGKQRAIRDDRWKLIRYPEVDVTQLFDVQADPHELTNLAAAQPDRVATMLAHLAKRQTEFGDTQPLTAPNPKPAAITAEALRQRGRKPKSTD